MRRPGCPAGFLATVVTALLFGMPGVAEASTRSEAPLPTCDLPTSTVVAGTPLELSGKVTRSDEVVGLAARSASGAFREGTVALVDDTWRGVIVFGAGDGGAWNLEIIVDAKSCVSPITVTLPSGVVAPPTREAPTTEPGDERPPGIDASRIREAVSLGGALAVVASWVFLLVVVLANALGARPLARRGFGPLARVTTFIGVLGAFVGVGIFVYFGYAMAHFDSGIPPEQVMVLDLMLLGMMVAGSVVGVIAAQRVRPEGRRSAD